jgi:hypothetical protein
MAAAVSPSSALNLTAADTAKPSVNSSKLAGVTCTLFTFSSCIVPRQHSTPSAEIDTSPLRSFRIVIEEAGTLISSCPMYNTTCPFDFCTRFASCAQEDCHHDSNTTIAIPTISHRLNLSNLSIVFPVYYYRLSLSPVNKFRNRSL